MACFHMSARAIISDELCRMICIWIRQCPTRRHMWAEEVRPDAPYETNCKHCIIFCNRSLLSNSGNLYHGSLDLVHLCNAKEEWFTLPNKVNYSLPSKRFTYLSFKYIFRGFAGMQNLLVFHSFWTISDNRPPFQRNRPPIKWNLSGNGLRNVKPFIFQRF